MAFLKEFTELLSKSVSAALEVKTKTALLDQSVTNLSGNVTRLAERVDHELREKKHEMEDLLRTRTEAIQTSLDRVELENRELRNEMNALRDRLMKLESEAAVTIQRAMYDAIRAATEQQIQERVNVAANAPELLLGSSTSSNR